MNYGLGLGLVGYFSVYVVAIFHIEWCIRKP